MTKWRHSIKLLGLTMMAAFSMLALTAVSAQASSEPYIVSGGNHVLFKNVPISAELVSGSADGAGKLLVPGLGIIILCENGAAHGTVGATGGVSASVLFEDCGLVDEDLNELPDCLIYPSQLDLDMDTNKGHITATGTGLIIKHNGAHYLTVKGLGTSKIFTIVYFHGEFCPLAGLETEITGETGFLLPTALTLALNQVLRPLLHAEGLLIGAAGLSFGGEPAEIHGSDVLARLASDAQWGIL